MRPSVASYLSNVSGTLFTWIGQLPILHMQKWS